MEVTTCTLTPGHIAAQFYRHGSCYTATADILSSMLLAFLRSLCNLLQGIVVVLLAVMSHAVTLYQPLYIKNDIDIPNVPARTYRVLLDHD